jgi:transposase
MADPLPAGDGLWEVLERLLPERPAQRIGRPRVEDRIAFTAIVFVLVTGLSWRLVPQRSLHLPLLSLGCALIFCRRLQR